MVAYKLGYVIDDNGVRDPKPINNVTEERGGLRQCELHEWFCLDPLGVFVHCDEQVGETLGCLLEVPDQVQPLDHEGPGDGDSLQGMCLHVRLSCIILATLTSSNDLLGVCNGGRPVETLPEGLPNQGSGVAYCPHVFACMSTSRCRPSSTRMHLCLIPETLFL